MSKELLDFGAEWCGTCEKIKPTIKQLEKETPTVKFTYLDCDLEPAAQLASSYQVKQLPTLILLENGEEVWRHIGTISMEQLKERLQ